MEAESKRAAEQINDWFGRILHLTSGGFFGMAGGGPHRNAVVLDVLRRNARILLGSEIDEEGRLYSPLCFFLAAACQTVGVVLATGHWLAAINNLIQLRQEVATAYRESASVGLDIGTPAVLFKQELDEAIRQSGLVSGASFLGKESREVALGLAVNWAMRFLLAYAAESAVQSNGSDRQDLVWVASLVRNVISSAGSSQLSRE